VYHVLHITQVFVSEQKRLLNKWHQDYSCDICMLFCQWSKFLRRKFLRNFFFAGTHYCGSWKKLQESQKFEPAKILGHTASDPLGKTFYMHTCTYKDAKTGQEQKRNN